jgi:hypothetical protein
MQRNAAQGRALQSTSKQRGLPTGNSGFSGPLWLESVAVQCKAVHGIAGHGKATRIGAWRQALFRAALAHPAGFPRSLYQLIDNGENNMAMRNATVTITGTTALLQNNPQTVDRFNKYAKRMKEINAKGTRRTDDDYLELRDIEVESKLYFDPTIGVYVPAGWLAEAVATAAFRVAKISKANIRGAMFVGDDKIKLNYRDSSKVKKPADIVGNDSFRQMLTLPQGPGAGGQGLPDLSWLVFQHRRGVRRQDHRPRQPDAHHRTHGALRGLWRLPPQVWPRHGRGGACLTAPSATACAMCTTRSTGPACLTLAP